MTGPPRPFHVVVMGVSGSGKSTVAAGVRDALGGEFAEGDEFHPAENIAKMSAGRPLTDEDRWPWLERLADWTRQQDLAGRSTVVTCSALRRAYRDVLRRDVPDTFFLHPHGDASVIADRMSHREHFMPASLLPSQLETLEPLEADERGAVIDLAGTPQHVVALAVARVAEEFGLPMSSRAAPEPHSQPEDPG